MKINRLQRGTGIECLCDFVRVVPSRATSSRERPIPKTMALGGRVVSSLSIDTRALALALAG
jgi:hypothetical protein